jgi:glycine/D-amino acid oxidase-like deaminating enzyme
MGGGKTIGVVGRGIAGLAAAFELRRAGYDVSILGPRRADEPVGVGTRAAGGVCAIKGAVLPLKPLFAAKKAGQEMLPAWLSEVERVASGPRIPRYLGGVSELFFDRGGYEGLRARVFHRKFTGCYRAEVLDLEELMRRGSAVSSVGLAPPGGFFYAHDLWYDPEAALVALEAALRSLRAVFIDTNVTRIVEHPDSGLAIQGRLGTHRFDEVVVAAGVWTDAVLRESLITAFPSQTAFAGETLRGKAPVGVSSDFVTSFEKTSLVKVGARLQYGSSCYSASSLFEGPNAASVAALRAKIAARAPRLAFDEVVFGLRARTPDRLPACGPLFLPSGNRRVWVLTGLYKNGLQLAPLFARNLLHALPLSASYGPFVPSRFA